MCVCVCVCVCLCVCVHACMHAYTSTILAHRVLSIVLSGGPWGQWCAYVCISVEPSGVCVYICVRRVQGVPRQAASFCALRSECHLSAWFCKTQDTSTHASIFIQVYRRMAKPKLHHFNRRINELAENALGAHYSIGGRLLVRICTVKCHLSGRHLSEHVGYPTVGSTKYF